MHISDATARKIVKALDAFEIELPSWGFADTGTRFGKFHQPAAASTVEEKFHDAGLVNSLTGACPTVAVHVLWDFDMSGGTAAYKATKKLASEHGIGIGSINANVFQDQCYKYGSYCSPDDKARQQAIEHTLECIDIGQATGSKLLTLWLADGTNYPGQDSIYQRKARLESALKQLHQAMVKKMRGGTMLVEYKPFEPAFYHTDISDWGMAHHFAKSAGKQAKVLVDTGHHLPGANIEHIVAFLLSENMLGGFHFNDRKYADDDLTMGSIDPYAVFRIFDQIAQFEFETGKNPGSTEIAYMIDQSHNLKPKLEAMVQTVCEAQKLVAKAQTVDRRKLAKAQQKQDLVGAETLLKEAYEADVTPVLEKWRESKGLPLNPLAELRNSGIITKLGKEREKARRERGDVVGSSYA